MRIFEGGEKSWSSKTNFVDKNNVLVGFDSRQNCCENFGWFLSTKQPHKIGDFEIEQPSDLGDYDFDTSYFKEPDFTDDTDGGGQVTFRLVSGDREMFLTLFNHHNGYYAHGFEMIANDAKLQSGYL